MYISQKQLNERFGAKVDDSHNEMPPRKLVIKPFTRRRIGTQKNNPRRTSFSQLTLNNKNIHPMKYS